MSTKSDTKLEFWPNVVDLALKLDLPNVEETTSYRQPCLKAHKKLWVWCSPHEDAFAFKVPVDERDILIGAEPGRYFVTDHYLGYDIVLVRPSELDTDWARNNMQRVWRELAGKKYVQKFDAEST